VWTIYNFYLEDGTQDLSFGLQKAWQPTAHFSTRGPWSAFRIWRGSLTWNVIILYRFLQVRHYIDQIQRESTQVHWDNTLLKVFKEAYLEGSNKKVGSKIYRSLQQTKGWLAICKTKMGKGRKLCSEGRRLGEFMWDTMENMKFNLMARVLLEKPHKVFHYCSPRDITLCMLATVWMPYGKPFSYILVLHIIASFLAAGSWSFTKAFSGRHSIYIWIVIFGCFTTRNVFL